MRSLLVIGAVALCGCSPTLGEALHKAEVLRGLSGTIALTAMHATCGAKARTCAKGATAKDCPAWAACNDARDKFLQALTAVGDGLAGANRVVHDLGIGGAK